jgi:hypothetical protein
MTRDDHFGRPAILSVLYLAKFQSLSEGVKSVGTALAQYPYVEEWNED